MAIVVLVHGTTAGGWVWRDVRPYLEAAGHRVYTPTLTGLGERVHLAHPGINLDTHIQDIVNVLDYEELQGVALVGHSYAGMVITGVADRVPQRIAQLVYLDAIVPRDGESMLDHMDPAAREERARQVATEGQGWLMPIAHGPNDLPGKNTPHPWATWTQPLRLQDPEIISRFPRTYVRCTADKAPGSPFERAMAMAWARVQAGGWRVVEIDTVHQILPDPRSKGIALACLLGS